MQLIHFDVYIIEKKLFERMKPTELNMFVKFRNCLFFV